MDPANKKIASCAVCECQILRSDESLQNFTASDDSKKICHTCRNHLHRAAASDENISTPQHRKTMFDAVLTHNAEYANSKQMTSSLQEVSHSAHAQALVPEGEPTTTTNATQLSVQKLSELGALKMHRMHGVLRRPRIRMADIEPDLHHWYVYERNALTFVVHLGLMDDKLFVDVGAVGTSRLAAEIAYQMTFSCSANMDRYFALGVNPVSNSMRYQFDPYGANKSVVYRALVDTLDCASAPSDPDACELVCDFDIMIPDFVLCDVSTNLLRIRCRKCRVLMTPPVFECEQGHVFCEDCADEKDGMGWCYDCVSWRLSALPETNDTKNRMSTAIKSATQKRRVSMLRSPAMERICRWMTGHLSCRWPGCQSIPSNNIRLHERTCAHRTYPCIWWCDYSGDLASLQRHLRAEHADKALCDGECEARMRSTAASWDGIIIAHGELFSVTVTSVPSGAEKNFYVCYKSPPRSLRGAPDEFSCTVRIETAEGIVHTQWHVPFYTRFSVSADEWKQCDNEFSFVVKVDRNQAQ